YAASVGDGGSALAPAGARSKAFLFPSLAEAGGCGIEFAPGFQDAALMSKLSDVLQLRVRYSETDQMGTFYNSRALEWFECGRTELMRRRLGMSYSALEEKGVFLPVVEAHVEYLGGARYDDLLEVSS